MKKELITLGTAVVLLASPVGAFAQTSQNTMPNYTQPGNAGINTNGTGTTTNGLDTGSTGTTDTNTMNIAGTSIDWRIAIPVLAIIAVAIIWALSRTNDRDTYYTSDYRYAGTKGGRSRRRELLDEEEAEEDL